MSADTVNFRAAAILNECGFLRVMDTVTLPEGHYVALAGKQMVACGPWPPVGFPVGVTDVFVPPDILSQVSEAYPHD